MDTTRSRVRGLAVAALAASTLFVFGATPASAQWSIEGRLGATLPTGDLSGALDQTAGLAVAADVMYTFRRNVTFYGGVGHHRFNCDGCDTDLTSTGFGAGLKYLFGQSETAMPWIRGGLIVHKPGGNGDGDWGPGIGAGVGIDWSVSHQVDLVPALRFDRYSSGNATLSWFTIDLGLHLHVGG